MFAGVLLSLGILGAADATALLKKFECNRCHVDLAQDAPIPADAQCVICHQSVVRGTYKGQLPAEATRRRNNIKVLTMVPGAKSVGAYLRRDWLEDFLRQSHVVRPGLGVSMPRFNMSKKQAKRLAKHLVPKNIVPKEKPATAAEIAAGRGHYESNNCGMCHRFDGASVRQAQPSTAGVIAMAPDLRFTRERMSRATVAKWITHPTMLHSETLMPAFEVTDNVVQALAAFVSEKPLAKNATAVVHTPPKPLARKVTFAHVQPILRRNCTPCHSPKDEVVGHGGPGNTGGFGFQPRGFDASSYQGIEAGYLDKKGRRQSVFSKVDGVPRLVRGLLARHAEAAGNVSPSIVGMPMALPPLSMSEIQLISTWIEQGRAP